MKFESTLGAEKGDLDWRMSNGQRAKGPYRGNGGHYGMALWRRMSNVGIWGRAKMDGQFGGGVALWLPNGLNAPISLQLRNIPPFPGD